jgi:OmpA-OmpF porin, OOP family
MKKRNMTRLLMVVLTVNVFTTLFAQSKISTPAKSMSPVHQQWEIGLQGGVMEYNGDLNTFGLKGINTAFGGTAKYHFSDNFALRGNFIAGKISGNDADYPATATRGLKFSAGVRELSILGELDLLGKRRFSQGFRRTLSPYLFGGVAASSIAPNVFYFEGTNDLAKMNIDKQHQNKKILLAIPIGAGLKLDLTEKWTLNVEAGYRMLFSDYADGISLLANPSNNDSYAYAGVTIGYRIPVVTDTDKDGIKDAEDVCPTFKGTKKMKGCPDADGDGVSDVEDLCPKEVGTAENKGCPDADGDGVSDKNDKCPNEKGTAATKGCLDQDGDGFADADDVCPTLRGTLKGCPDADSDGIADAEDDCPTLRGTIKGCPDADGDEIADKDDKCPNEKGVLSEGGCPKKVDTDGDGITDKEDKCPTAAGSARMKGCPDRDNDEVADKDDVCPDVAGSMASRGCPEVKESDKQILEKAIYGVQFETGNSKLKTSSYPTLDNVVKVLQRNEAYNLDIKGHTDDVGDDNVNMILSENRAKACYNYFIEKGISAGRMTFEGLGETQPIGENNSAQGRAKNRRVQFVLEVK